MKSFKKRMTPESGSKRTDKADDVLVALTQGKNGENKQSEELCLWDLIKCEACGSGEFEERIILCDGCDAEVLLSYTKLGLGVCVRVYA